MYKEYKLLIRMCIILYSGSYNFVLYVYLYIGQKNFD